MQLDKNNLLAFVTKYGSAQSHTAILARTINIPALTGVIIDADWDGKMAIVDSFTGEFIIEPDEETLKETLNHFKQMKEDNVGVLLITHDIHAALEIADRIGIFYSGYVIEIAENNDFSGDGEKLLHPYTKALYKALPANGFKLTKGHQPLHGEIPEGCPYYDRCEMAFDRCKNERPQLISIGNKKVRCFKYDGGVEDGT